MAKTLLTLNRHTGKSEEERSAAMTLLDLSSEPVVSSGEPYEEKHARIRTGRARRVS